MKHFEGRDKTLTGDTIELVKAEYSNSLGPNLELIDCEIISRDVARGIIISGLKMTGGVWRQKKKLSTLQFSRAHFDNVRFEGHFYNCRFGDFDPPEQSSVKRCDFTGAKLSYCEFVDVDPQEVKFGLWPTVGFYDPQQFKGLLPDLNMPDPVRISLNTMAKRPEQFRLSVYQASDFGKRAGLTDTEVRAIVEPLPGVVIHDG